MSNRYLALSATVALFAISSSQAALVITEAMPSSNFSGDWFEITNTGPSAINLAGYYWDDNGPTGADGAVFPDISIAVGQSIVIVDEDNADLADWIAAWGGGVTAYSSEDFSGDDAFSGLGGGGDQIEIWDSNPNVGPANLVASAVFGSSTDGSSFQWDTSGNFLGVSSSGVNGAFASTSGGDIASPGAAVPEPGSALLAALGLLGFLRRRR
ncbi:lamin tail domain-containing protein [Haloferula chungangensis]